MKRLRQSLARGNRRLGPPSALSVGFEYAEGVSVCLLKSGAMIVQAAPQVAGATASFAWGLYRTILTEELGFLPADLPGAPGAPPGR